MESIEQILKNKVQPVDAQYEPASESDIASAEKQMGVLYPQVFRELQLVYGRFMFEGDATVQCDSLGEALGVFTVFGCKGEHGNLVADFQAHPDLQGRRLVPFADDLFNNRYVFDAMTGEVSFVDYSRNAAIHPVAKNLVEFFDRIVVLPDV